MLHLAADRGFNRFRICFAWLRHTSTVAALSDPESMEATFRGHYRGLNVRADIIPRWAEANLSRFLSWSIDSGFARILLFRRAKGISLTFFLLTKRRPSMTRAMKVSTGMLRSVP